MPIVHVPVHLTIEQLLAAVKQLSAGELHEFTEQFAAWQKQHDQQDEEEAALLVCIAENSRLPAADQRRFNRLRCKHQAETLTNGCNSYKRQRAHARDPQTAGVVPLFNPRRQRWS